MKQKRYVSRYAGEGSEGVGAIRMGEYMLCVGCWRDVPIGLLLLDVMLMMVSAGRDIGIPRGTNSSSRART